MAPTDGAGPDSGRATAPLARRHVIALTIAGAGLAGVVGGFAAFGVAHAVSGDDTSLTSSGRDVPTTQTMEVPAPRTETLTPDTVTVTPTPTESSSSAAPTTSASAPRGSGTPAGRDSGDDSGEAPAVLPERVLPTLTTTPGADDDRAGDGNGRTGDGGADVRQAGVDDADGAAPTTTSPGASDRDRDDSEKDADTPGDAERTTTVPAGDGGDERDPERPEADRGDRTDTEPREEAPDNALLSDRAPLTATRIDGAFRNALAPGVPGGTRDSLFEGGAESRPLSDRLATLSTGSVSLLHWSVHDPVIIDGNRATVRVRSDVLFNQAWRPVTFVNVDGEWKLTRESTCELSASLLLPCA